MATVSAAGAIDFRGRLNTRGSKSVLTLGIHRQGLLVVALMMFSNPRSNACLRALVGMITLLGVHAADPASVEFFENRIRPVLVERCYECHSAQSEALKGGLRLDAKAGWEKGGASGSPSIVPGKPESSLLIQVVKGTAADVKAMPPKGGALKAEQIADLEAWVLAGAPDPRTGEPALSKPDPAARHWAFQPPRMPARPAVKKASWPRTGMDWFVLAALEAKGLTPTPEADRRTLLRRVTHDLTGLPPTPEAMESFLKDRSEHAYARVVDRLLASPAYGERWGRHWLDVARYADSKGYVFEEERRYPYSHTYRDWVVEAFNRDLPYDRFLIEQLAGDQVATETDRKPLAAMGFLTLGRRFLNNQSDIIDDRIDVTTRGLMGLTVQCARCHDHKFDPIPTADYYSLYGLFSNSHEPDPKPLVGENPDRVQAADYDKELAKRRKDLNDYRAEQTALVIQKLRSKIGDYLLTAQESMSLDGGAQESLARQRSLDPGLVSAWKGRLEALKKAPHPVFSPWFAWASLPTNDFAARAPKIAEEVAGGRWQGQPLNARLVADLTGWSPTNLTHLAARYGRLFQQVNTEWTNAVAEARKSGQPEPKALPDAAAEELRQVLYAADSPIQGALGGIDRFFDTPVAQKSRALKRKLDELDATHPGAPLRAMALMDNTSISDPVIFKRGNPGNHGPKVPRQQLAIVAGPGRKPFTQGSGRLEFARSVASPDNPLTARVMVNRVWMRHFGTPLVKTPSDFGVRTDPPSHPELLDYLALQWIHQGWSMKALHREMVLSATYRQASDPEAAGLSRKALAKARTVDPANTLFWRMNRQRTDFESMRDGLLAVCGNLDPKVGGLAVAIYDTDKPALRRTLYGYIDRQNLPGILRSFDFASPDTSSAGRFQTSVPQQALFWLNSGFVADQARAILERPDVKSLEGDARVKRLYALVYQRDPSRRELTAAREFLRQSPAATTPEAPVAEVASGNEKPADRKSSQTAPKPLNPWEQYAQVLLAANEFAFID